MLLSRIADQSTSGARVGSIIQTPSLPVALLLINPRISAYEISCTSCLKLIFRFGQHTQIDTLKPSSTTAPTLHSNPLVNSQDVYTQHCHPWSFVRRNGHRPWPPQTAANSSEKDGQDIQGHPHGQQHSFLVLSRSSSGHVEAISKRYNGLLHSR